MSAPPKPSVAPPPPAPRDGDGGSPPEPPSDRPPAPDGDARPATIADLRSLRRWLVVAAVWAVAATAIAVLAFITASDDDDQRLAETNNQAQSIQRRVNRQVEQLETRLEQLPQSSSIRGLQQNLTRLTRVTARQDRQLAAIGTQLETIRERIATLEEAPPADETDTTTTP